tara:strand:+ start:524 stop:3022 length:2499 start_codon:yes stop_codon:yes gene_type:complete
MSERERLARIEYDHPPAAYRTSDASESEKAAMLETEVERLLGQLTLEEKVSLCHANSKFAVAGVDRLQIKPMWMSDGPHGVRNEISFDSWAPAGWDTDFATYLPVLSGVAASFNIEMASLHGSVLGSEARERKKDIILGPGVNMVRTPICGRNFEYCGEDPYLAGKIAASEIRAIQKNDVAACLKHFSLNLQELNRKGVDMRPDERTLRELYLPAFEIAVKEGGTWSVMGAYNEYMGENCSQSRHLLTDILKGEWKFDGTVITDWNVDIKTKDAALNGLDIEMGTKKPYHEYFLADPFLAQLKSGEISTDVLDGMARRILRMQLRMGMQDGHRKLGERNTEKHQQIARTIAEETVVLLKNDKKQLPLNQKSIKTLLVLGHNADKKHGTGGGSSQVKSSYEITPLEGLKQKLGDQVEITYMEASAADGYEPISGAWVTSVDPGPGTPAWKLEFFNEKDMRVATEYVGSSDVTATMKRIKKYFTQVILSATVKPESTGEYTFATVANGGITFQVDGKKIGTTIPMEADREYEFAITCAGFKPHQSKLFVGWERKGRMENAYLQAAKKADAVIYFGGIDHTLDKEGQDKPNLKSLDGSVPDKLLAVRPDTILFMMGGSPIEMPWLDNVDSLLWGFYGGQEAGHAYADILFGDVNPSAKLPMTFPARLEDSPAHALDDYNAETVVLKEGVFMGYRWYEHKNIKPLFPFGYGLSYTDFTYSNLKLSSTTMGPDDTLEISYTVTNTGNRFGQEATQLYIQDIESSVARPVKELKGFAKVALEPGESKAITHTIDQRALSFWDTPNNTWKTECGDFNILIGSSSDHITLQKPFSFNSEK